MVALEAAVAQPRSFAGVVLVDGGVMRLRDGFASWPQAKAALTPPDLRGMPVEEFRSLIPAFYPDPVTPQIEAVILSVMRVDREGRIHPRLRRDNHFRILRQIWEQDPVALHTRLRIPSLAIVAHGTGEPEWDARKRRAVASLGPSLEVNWIRGIHDLPIQRPTQVTGRIERFAQVAVG
jgi:pimeloyl-ACP methyl ester carboxylesterase